MKESSIQKRYGQIADLLRHRHLRDAQDSLRDLLSSHGDWSLRSRLEQAATTYAYMLQYMRQGVDDPGRNRLYRQLLAETWEIADLARLQLLSAVSTRTYISLRSQWASPNRSSEHTLATIRCRLEQTCPAGNAEAGPETRTQQTSTAGPAGADDTSATQAPAVGAASTAESSATQAFTTGRRNATEGPTIDTEGTDIQEYTESHSSAPTGHTDAPAGSTDALADPADSTATGTTRTSTAKPASTTDTASDTADTAIATDLARRQAHEDAQRDLTLCVWAGSPWTTEEAAEAQDILLGGTLPTADVCLMASAVTLALMECWDMRKVCWLIDACQHDDVEVSCRALTGLALTDLLHPDRTDLYPTLAARFSLLQEDHRMTGRLQLIYLQLLRSKDTDRVVRKMREEIMPDVVRNFQELRRRKFDLDNPADESDPNPDWDEAFEQTILHNKLNELVELHLEGADLGMGTFSSMKHFPFFAQLCNWLLPFDIHHSTLPDWLRTDTLEMKPMQAILESADNFCDNDKYSLCFLLNSIPPAERDRMLSKLMPPDQSEQAVDEMTSALQKVGKRTPETVCRQYIQGLYRLLRISPWRGDLHDIFAQDIHLHLCPHIGPMLSRPDLLQAVAQLHLKQEHYADLRATCQYLIDHGAGQADTYQKLGYALQKEKDHAAALKAYEKADLIQPDHTWTLRQMGTCHRHLHQYAEAADCYRRVLQAQPDNRQVISLVGSCLAEQGAFEQALPYFFRLDLMQDDNLKAWRAIAWCSLATDRLDQATKYYDRLLAQPNPTVADLLNAGHAAWLAGQLDRAVERYARVVAQTDRPSFLDAFTQDQPFLLEHGLRKDDIPLVLDMV